MESYLEEILPGLVEEGIFGLDENYVEFEIQEEKEYGAQFPSKYGNIKLTVMKNQGFGLRFFVAKIPKEGNNEREMRMYNDMFHNELMMYDLFLTCLPVSRPYYVKQFYSSSKIILLQDSPYKIFYNNNSVFLDLEHILISIKALAYFHSLSYSLKKGSIKEFKRISSNIREVEKPKEIKEKLNDIKYAAMQRGISPLMKNSYNKKENIQNYDVLNEFLEYLKSPDDVGKEIAICKDKYSVICHGDFCATNICFGYDKKKDLISCKIFDFKSSRVASPAIDIFNFLYTHTDSEFRRGYWEGVLEYYWDEVYRMSGSFLNKKKFFHHLNERAVYGYMNSSWYIPVLMDNNLAIIKRRSSLNKARKANKKYAGHMEGDKVITDIVQHMYDNHYIENFIKHYKYIHRK